MTTGTNRFHEAARDGYLDFLREATRRDCNAPDDTGMTPTLWAAYQGNVDALRLLVGRGGDPDKCDFQGHSAVHFSALAGHLNVLMFLISFGCNIWGLNNEYRTAKDLAAENGHTDCLTLLDEEVAKQSSTNRKQVQKLKEKSLSEADKRVRKYRQMQKEHEKRLLKEQKKLEKETKRKYTRKPSRESQKNQKRYSRRGTDVAAENRAKRLASIGFAGGKVIDVDENGDLDEDGKDVESFIDEQFDGIQHDDPWDEDNDDEDNDIREAGFWLRTERPIANTMLSLPSDGTNPKGATEHDDLLSGAVEIEHVTNVPKVSTTHLNDNLREYRDPVQKHLEVPEENGDLPWDDEDLEDLEDDEITSPLELFLAINNLDEYLPLFSREDVDLEALMLLTDDDLKNMRLPLGPRRKLAGAIKQRKDALDIPGAMTPTEL